MSQTGMKSQGVEAEAQFPFRVYQRVCPKNAERVVFDLRTREMRTLPAAVTIHAVKFEPWLAQEMLLFEGQEGVFSANDFIPDHSF